MLVFILGQGWWGSVGVGGVGEVGKCHRGWDSCEGGLREWGDVGEVG